MSSHITPVFRIRPARHEEVATAANIIADSFGPVEPYLIWLFPHSQDRAKSALPLIQLWAEDAYAAGTLMVAVTATEASSTDMHTTPECVAGAAIWEVEGAPAGKHASAGGAFLTQCRHFGRMVTKSVVTLPIMWRTLGKHFWRYYFEAFLSKNARGFEEQCYLSSLAVAPAFRGFGVAAQLLHQPPRKDLLLTLECREELVGFYLHNGFIRGRCYCLPRTTTMVSFSRFS
ncbi:hypothetical protein IY73_00790 [Lawsonella clevelandensis]|uniref:GNAT family N-acetyltransferase n=1 Tax=Lawsonella clevelandensis TaxID=1528099 RepID=UPI0006B5A0E1|nr:GNAT family N-acetyltransferase [Lawsonella clevelandensis]ALE34151.1 hypothetical protein IY73_00790 [Lawsonella clevelandensis]